MHGRFIKKNEQYYYEDLDSLNGIYFNGVHIGGKNQGGTKEVPLKSGDVLRIDHNDLNNPHNSAVVIVVMNPGGNKVTVENVALMNEAEIVIGRIGGDIKVEDMTVRERMPSFK